ncbi:MAG: L-histidine N(alpha)-methyltransferase [Gammaproteobacteria bacterium]|nr:MAG: L-histidine N(alpha)-methyltransferase [Gammaproteobacteria bacterium]
MSKRGEQAMARKRDEDGEREELLDGLSGPDKQVSPKYFYDETGSQLFEAICEQPEYYPTRTELAIMRAHAREMAQALGPRICLVEYGSGASVKTRLLLDALEDPVAYVPVDISAEMLATTAEALASDYPELEILPLCADFTQPLTLPKPRRQPQRTAVYFPGSTIGNFTREDSLALLRKIHAEIGAGGALLIGTDLVKSRELLEPAYNDAAGVTAEFNLNLLRHLNREFDADFDLDGFHHEAVYDERQRRIEMRLVSDRRQRVTLGGETIRFDPGEYIVTEHSHKYSLDDFATLAASAGFTVRRIWLDRQAWFAVQYLEPA